MIPHVAYWLKKGGFAAVDQGLFSAANFLVNILLARWLEPVHYGAFMTIYSVILFLGAFHSAVLTEPMLIFGAGKYANQFRQYVGLLLYDHMGLTIVASMLLSFVALGVWHLSDRAVACALWGGAAATPFVLLLWLLRRAFYVHMQPQWAAIGGAFYLVLILAGISILYREEQLAPASAFVVMGVAGICSGSCLVGVLKPQWCSRENTLTNMTVMSDHWEFGRWNVVAAVGHWFSGHILLILVPLLLGLEATAVVAAILNLFRPLNPLIQSVTALLLPTATKLLHDDLPLHLFMRQMGLFLLLYTGGVFVYGMLITIFSDPLIQWIYGGRYAEYAVLALLLTISYTGATTIQVITIIIKATGDPRKAATVWIASTVATGFLCVPAFLTKSLTAVLIVFAASYWITAAISWKQLQSLVTPKKLTSSL